MRHRLWGCALAASAVLGTVPGILVGQWGVTLDVQRAGFGGTSTDTSAGGRNGSFRPGGTAAVTLRVDRRIGRVAIGLGIRYVHSAVLLETPDFFIGIKDDFAAFEAVPEIRLRLARTAAGPSLHLYGGPVIGVWTFSDNGTRPVPGAIVGIAAELPLFARLALWVRAGGGLTRPVFREGELPAEFERHATRRTEVSLGLRYGR